MNITEWVQPHRENESDTFCITCGIPFNVHRSSSNRKYPWWEAVVIRAPITHGSPETEICEERHDGCGIPMEIIYDKDEPFPIGSSIDSATLTACLFSFGEYFCAVDHQWPAYRVFNCQMDFPYVALHAKCLEITQRVCNYRQLHGLEGPRSLGQFYEIYRDRIQMQGWVSEVWDTCFLRVIEPHYYYMRPGHFPRDRTRRDITYSQDIIRCDIIPRDQWPTERPDLLQYEASPFPIPDISSQILMFLQPVSASPSSTNMQTMKIPHLPEELLQMIFAHLHPFVDPPLECTRILPPHVWRRLIFYDGLFPWLWDLDPTALMSTRPAGDFPSYEADDFWDWKMLARQLAEVEVFEDGNLMDQLPLGLRNRRRIWRLIDEAEMSTD